MDPKPKLLFVSYTAEWTGPTRSLQLLLRELQAGFECVVVLPGNGSFSAALDAESIASISLPTLTKRHALQLARLARDGFDLVYANTADRSSRQAALAARLAGIPFICHVRSMGWHKSWSRLAHLRVADAVIAVSEATAASVRRHVQEGRLHVVHNGVDLAATVPADEPLGRIEHLEGDPLIVGAAHLCPRKGQEWSIAALADLRNEHPAARLLLLGRTDRDPDYTRHLEASIETLGLQEVVTLAGFEPEIERYLNVADIFIHSAVADPHPRAVVEAMAAGLPVVAFATDGVAETVLDGLTGYLVPKEDRGAMTSALGELAGDPELRHRMGEAGRQRAVAEFSAEATGAGVARILQRILSNDRA